MFPSATGKILDDDSWSSAHFIRTAEYHVLILFLHFFPIKFAFIPALWAFPFLCPGTPGMSWLGSLS